MPRISSIDTTKTKFRLEEELNRSGRKYELLNEILEKTGKSRTTIYEWRSAEADSKVDPPYQMVVIIAKILSIHPDDFYKSNVKMSFVRTA